LGHNKALLSDKFSAERGVKSAKVLMDKLTINWHMKITSEAETRLYRMLTPVEKLFIESRGSFMALEMIEDTVNNLTGEELRDYLNSDVSEK
jgi:hypothetical protein